MAVQFIADVALALGYLPHMEIGSATNILEIDDASLFRVNTEAVCNSEIAAILLTSTGMLQYFNSMYF
jgi:hypothetical protein